MKKIFKKIALSFLVLMLCTQPTFAVTNPNYWKKVGNAVELINPAWTLNIGNQSFSGDQTFDGTLTVDETDPNAFLVRKNNSSGNVFNVDTTNPKVTGSASLDFTGDTYTFNKVSNPTGTPDVALISPVAAGNVDNGDYTYAINFSNSNTAHETALTADSDVVTVVDNTVNGKIVLTNIPQPTTGEMDLINIYRNQNTNGYLLVASVARGTTTYTDNIDQATVDGNAISPSNVNSTGSFTVNGDLAAASNFNVYGVSSFSAAALFAFSGTSVNAYIDGVGNQVVFPFMDLSPSNGAGQSHGLMVAPGTSVDYTGDLALFQDSHSGNGTTHAKIDQYANFVSGTGSYSAAHANIDVQDVHENVSYGIYTGLNIPNKFNELLEFGAPGSGHYITNSKFQIGVDASQIMRINVPNGTGLYFSHNGVDVVQNRAESPLTLIQKAALNGTTASLLTATAAAHTNWSATNKWDVKYDLARTVQFSSVDITEQSAFIITNPTYAFNTAAHVMTDASTFTIAGAPIAGTNATLTRSMAMWVKGGLARFDGRFSGKVGAVVASANNLTLGTDGNTFHISGTTQINCINSAGWANGEITLIFNASTTVKQNQTCTGTNLPLLLAGSADFSATADTVLKVMVDATAIREISRTNP